MTTQPTKPRILSVVLFTALAIASFTVAAQENTRAGVDPGYGGTLVIGINGDVDSFNPLFNETAIAQEITHLFLLGLADLNEKSEFVPALATSWERSEDFLQLTYHLRRDAAWSDGVPITAEDVKFTFDLLMDSTVASPRQGVTEYIKRVTVPDPYTVTFEFTKAYPDQIFDTAGEILPKHIFAKADRSALRSHAFGRNPISSGPFILSKWVSQQYLEIAPNEMYYGGRPYLERVIFKIVPDQTNLQIQLQSGEVDMMVGVPPANVEGLRRQNPNLDFYPVSGRVYYYMGYNLKNPLFSSRAVRQALTMAIDRHGIIKALLYGSGKPCLGPLPPMIAWAYDGEAQEIPFTPQGSRELLAKAGWTDHDGDGWLDKDGRKFEFTLKTNSGNQIRSDVAIIVQNQLKQVGVKVEIQTMERTTLMRELRAKQFDAYMGGWSTSFNVDQTPIFHSASGDLFNFVSYANPQIDRLIETGREEMDQSKASAVWKEAQQLIYQDQPYTFLFWKDKVVAVRNQFKNVTPIALSSLFGLEKWYLSQATN